MRIVSLAAFAIFWSAFVVSAGTARARDDVADVRAAEFGLNAAQNAGDVEKMFGYYLESRTMFLPTGGPLIVGWSEKDKSTRKAQVAAGLKIDNRIDDFAVRVYGDTAVTTFLRTGTMVDPVGSTRASHLRLSGVWVRTAGQWKLAHRHESSF